MKSYRLTIVQAMLFYGLFGSVCIKSADELTYVTGAPVGDLVDGEPGYLADFSPSVDWFSGEIAGNYYLASLAPLEVQVGTDIAPTIAVYQFVPGTLPELGSLTFIDSAPTGQSPAGSGTGGPIDGPFTEPQSVSWFPGAINGNYYFTVVGNDDDGALGIRKIRLYQFIPALPTTDGVVIFIDSAPVPGEISIFDAYSVDWFPDPINGVHYFAVTSGFVIPEVRVYSFDPVSQTLGWEGAAAIDSAQCDGGLDNNHAHLAWAPGLLNGEAFLAVGDDEKLRIFRFCPDMCGSGTGGSEVCPFFKPQSLRMELVTTSSITPPGNLNQPWGVRWLRVGEEVYIVAGCESGKAKLFQFFQDSNDSTTGVINYVTEVPTGGVSCGGEADNDIFNIVRSVDWLTKDGAYYLVIGGFDSGEPDMGKIRVYRFDPRRKRFTLLAVAPTFDEFLSFEDVYSVDWFPGKIMDECYFAAGVERDIGPIGSVFGSEDTGVVRIYNFDPLCANSLLSWRYPHIQK